MNDSEEELGKSCCTCRCMLGLGIAGPNLIYLSITGGVFFT